MEYSYEYNYSYNIIKPQLLVQLQSDIALCYPLVAFPAHQFLLGQSLLYQRCTTLNSQMYVNELLFNLLFWHGNACEY